MGIRRDNIEYRKLLTQKLYENRARKSREAEAEFTKLPDYAVIHRYINEDLGVKEPYATNIMMRVFYSAKKAIDKVYKLS